MSLPARLAATLVALIAWVALGTQFLATYGSTRSVPAALWQMLFYFTIIATLLTALVYSAVALGRAMSPFLLAATALGMLLVGITFNTLLLRVADLPDAPPLADLINHTVLPILVPVWWLLFAKKGQLGWHDPVTWTILPAAYFLYAILRGHAEHAYPYPFVNVTRLGWASVTVNGILVAGGVLALGYVIVVIDKALGGRR
jgi:hypothetical protein